MNTVICECCKKEFERNRWQLAKPKSYYCCSRKCAGTIARQRFPKNSIGNLGNPENLNKGYNRADAYSGFRPHLRRVKTRTGECHLTLEDLKIQWETQKGLCAYTEIPLVHPAYTGKNSPVYTASLDRIDSSKGYEKDNIQFVAMCINYLKNAMSDKGIPHALFREPDIDNQATSFAAADDGHLFKSLPLL